ncbi:MAG: hypothetical protein ACI3Y4_04445 [Candidatus Cryptobacteroides sp.]
MKERIQDLFRAFKAREAFWAAAENVMTDSDSQTILLRIANQQNHIVKLLDDIDKIKKLADKGNPYMQYAFARLHDTLALQADSCEICEEYYTLALKAGIADAAMQLAFMYRDADLGEVDNRRFLDYFNRALDAGSERAVQFKLNQMIHGSDFVDADPHKALELICSYLDGSDNPDPYYYRIKAMAEEELGMKEEAAGDYELAISKGDSESYFLLSVLRYCDAEGNVQDAEGFTELMDLGQDAGAASAYLETACFLSEEVFDALDEERKKEVHSLLSDQLKLSSMLGGAVAAYFLGYYFENGLYGFEQDYGQAWGWYSRGALLRSASCYEALSRMVIEDETAPEHYDSEFGYECAYRAYILGADTLECLIRGYRNGHLTTHAAVIEEFFLPLWEQGLEEADEPEIEEDCYRDNVNLSELLEVCRTCLQDAKASALDAPWKVTALAEKFAGAAEVLKGYEHMLSSLYPMTRDMIGLITDHPRLKLRLCRIQLETLRYLEAVSGHELGITEDIEQEIGRLSSLSA